MTRVGGDRRSAVGVIFVNYHSERLIVERARRLQAAGFAVIVADNSGDFREPDIESFDTGGNVGFGVACNLAAKRLDVGIGTLCLHNPDVDAEDADLDRLCQALARQPRPGVVTPTEIQHAVVREKGYRYPNAGRELLLGAAAWRRDTSPRPTGELARRMASARGRRFGGGGLWVMDRAAFESVGGFDESYFLYAEDLDLWHRLRVAGRSAAFCPEVRIFHRTSTGSPMGAASREILRWAGVERFVEKFERPGAWRGMRMVHRALLPGYRRCAFSLAGSVGRMWDEGLSPEEAQGGIRRLLEPRRAGSPA